MKDFENKRKNQEVTEEIEKEVIKQKGKEEDSNEPTLLLLIFAMTIAFMIGLAVGGFIVEKRYKSTEESLQQEVTDAIDDQPAEESLWQKDEYNDYDWGAIQMCQILSLKDDVITFYKSDDITDEQMEEFVEAYLNIIDVSLRGDDITPEAINNYNEIIKEIALIDYDRYKLKSTGEDLSKGIKRFSSG